MFRGSAPRTSRGRAAAAASCDDGSAGARIEADLTGRSLDIGHEVDLVLALEEWERLEFEFIASASRPGAAFGRLEGKWSYGAFFAARYAF